MSSFPLLFFVIFVNLLLTYGYVVNRHFLKSKKYHSIIINGGGKGFGSGDNNISKQSIPKPNVIVPSKGSQNPNLDKFLMMYTCKICSGRNAHMVSKIAYSHGMVVATCRHCKTKHLIADNERKLDFPKEYGRKIEEYLESKGERVQRLSVSEKDLEDNYLVDEDGVVSLVSKMAGQVCCLSVIYIISI